VKNIEKLILHRFVCWRSRLIQWTHCDLEHDLNCR